MCCLRRDAAAGMSATRSRWSVDPVSDFKFRSAKRMMLAPRNTSGSFFLSRIGRQVRLALGLTVLAVPLSGCGTGALWDKFMTKEETFVDEPADKLYNEGLYLMNKKGDRKSAMKKFEEVDRQHPYSEWARKSLLMSAYAAYVSCLFLD